MPCFYSLSGYESRTLNPTGKRSIVFNPKDGFLDRPVDLPCGKCSGCRADQSLMWSIRAYHESTLHDRNCFVTLTYDDAHFPEDGAISKKHLQDFFKRLRKSLHPDKVRYIACGEYGDQTRRPHYHAILFGQDFRFDKVSINSELYTSPFLQERWGKGLVSIAPVTMASICYVCGYVTKKIADDDTFNLASRRPPIGHDWLAKYSDDLVRTGVVVIDGKEYPVPKRYLEFRPEEFEALKRKRKRYAKVKRASVDPVDHRRGLVNKEINKRSALQHRKEKL